ncbi:MAG: tetratricopeptide repeat protein [Candidatus Hydrogenedentes bacterium]|nr:tetratricopeptide repeat protein [Candidatus Hydrogenedentota bacterium]
MSAKEDVHTENKIYSRVQKILSQQYGYLSICATCLLIIVLYVSIAYLRFAPKILSRLEESVGENLMKFAMSLEKAKNPVDAKRIYEIATKSKFSGEFNRTYVLYRLGYLYWEDKEYEKSAEYLLQSVQSTFPQISAYPLLIDSMLKLNRTEECLPLIEKWLKEVRDREMYAEAHFYLGSVYKRLGQENKAEETWVKGHKILPGSKSTYELAIHYKSLNNCEKAVYYAESVLKNQLLPTREEYMNKIISQCKSSS